MEYWLIIRGSGDRPFRDGDWTSRDSDVHKFSRRPSVVEGDRLVSYAAGSHHEFGEGRVFKVSEAIGDPEPSDHERWPWQVEMRTLIAGPRLEFCPEITDFGVWRRSLGRHSHVRLREGRGEEAERLLAEAAREFGAVTAIEEAPR